jgi:hypothetical protein
MRPKTHKDRLRAIDQIHAELADLEERMRGLDIPTVHELVIDALGVVTEVLEEAGVQPGRAP